MFKRQNRFRRTFVAIIGACFAGLSSNAQAANLLTNPSFELGTFVNRGDGFQILPIGSTTIADWTVVNDSLAWGTVPNSAAGVNPITPFDGSFFLDLQGDGTFSAPYGGVMQTLTTVSGQQYHLAFNLGTEQSASSPATHGPISVTATAGSTSLPFTFDPGGTGTQWGEFGFDFTASSSSTPISIVGAVTTGGAYIGLDLVSVTLVPEPSTVALSACGALALLIGARRKLLNRSAPAA
ncbi:MAG TPA: DUF642 domain-containing protein [Lacipirellulaceae bacterium]|jgi:hypothetical protein